MKISFLNKEEEMVSYPSKYTICEICEGKGKHTNPSIDGNGLTSSDVEDWDDDTWENYRGGLYDVSCWLCKGERVVEIIDTDAANMTKAKTFADVNFWFEEFYYTKIGEVERNIRRAGGAFMSEDY
jgi:hypothetical protein